MNTENKIGIIYCIINKVNGKLYIGQTTTSIEKRFSSHKSRAFGKKYSSSILHKAFKKYGVDNFIIIRLWKGNSSLLNINEEKYIKLFESISPNGYNIRGGGESCRGYKLNEEARQNMSKGSARTKMTEEHKQRLIQINTGKKRTDLTKQRLSESHKGYKVKESTKELLRKLSTGRKLSVEACLKISKTHKGKKLTQEHKEKCAQIFKEHRSNPDTQAKRLNSIIDKTIYKFYHNDYGIEECNMYTLYKKYNLNRSCVRQVCIGNYKQHKGWRLLYEIN